MIVPRKELFFVDISAVVEDPKTHGWSDIYQKKIEVDISP